MECPVGSALEEPQAMLNRKNGGWMGTQEVVEIFMQREYEGGWRCRKGVNPFGHGEASSCFVWRRLPGRPAGPMVKTDFYTSGVMTMNRSQAAFNFMNL